MPLHDWLLAYITGEDPWPVRADPREDLDSLPGLMWHFSDAWARRHEPHVMLVHYDDLSAATFEAMKSSGPARADRRHLQEQGRVLPPRHLGRGA